MAATHALPPQLISVGGAFRPPERFLACRTCLAAEQIYPEPPSEPGEPSPSLLLLTAHAGHALEIFTRLGEAYLSDRPLWDPLGTRYVEVTDGHQVCVIRSARESIEEPLVRTLIHGRLRPGQAVVEAEDALLRRAVDAHFFPHALRPSKVERLLEELTALLRDLDPESLCVVFDATDDPQVSIARMPQEIYAALRQRCGEIFDAEEAERILGFLEQNRGDDGLLTLRVRRVFRLEIAGDGDGRLSSASPHGWR